MNNPKVKYVPILKWKSAEKSTIKDLFPVIKKSVIPLAELVPRVIPIKDAQGKIIEYKDKPEKDILNTGISYIKKNLSRQRIYVDKRHLKKIDYKTFLSEIQRPVQFFNSIIPVVYAEDIEEIRQDREIFLGATEKEGVCLRLTVNSTILSDLRKLEKVLVEEMEIPHSKIDVVLDHRDTFQQANLYVELVRQVVIFGKWRRVVLAGGAAPKTLSDYSVEEVGECERKDWLTWKEVNKKLAKGTQLIYGDYGTRHPDYEQITHPNTSYSIRYTAEKTWLIYRGKARNARDSQGPIQYRAHAILLKSHEVFAKHCNYCPGDAYVSKKAKLVDSKGNRLSSKHGSSTTWLLASTIHHVSTVLGQISSFT